MIEVIYHPTCSKSKKTREIFANTETVERNLEENMLTAAEILEISRTLGLTVQDLLRPNSPVYQERKDELYAMDEQSLAELIATEPTLVKRPIVKHDGNLILGLDEEKFAALTRADRA
ncbi:arsenate reductase family protein [Tumebacillus flagellatus]|uniref:Arsenate reductase n=1 Tax=Tumebacillus flagellatus TaxID=1157490 RepID=A0A074MFT2_9BACL|nr:ArsC/Spx/MgsR family protein [Tumebacillus flagellatus]KEO84592.1 hypothetical protein EL26_03485 [Tumebacillus flagellatus]